MKTSLSPLAKLGDRLVLLFFYSPATAVPSGFVTVQPCGDISPPDGRDHESLYDQENRQLRIFEEFNIHPEKEADRELVDWDSSCFLTRYYC